MITIVDHAAPGHEGPIGTRNSDILPSRGRRDSNGDLVHVPPKPKPMHVRIQSDYAFPGVDGFIAEAAKRAGFGLTEEEASLLNRIKSDWFLKRANDSLAHASTLTDPLQIKASLDRVRMMQRILALAATGIEDAILHRDVKPEAPTEPPEITDESRHVRTGEPQLKRGKLRTAPG